MPGLKWRVRNRTVRARFRFTLCEPTSTMGLPSPQRLMAISVLKSGSIKVTYCPVNRVSPSRSPSAAIVAKAARIVQANGRIPVVAVSVVVVVAAAMFAAVVVKVAAAVRLVVRAEIVVVKVAATLAAVEIAAVRVEAATAVIAVRAADVRLAAAAMQAVVVVRLAAVGMPVVAEADRLVVKVAVRAARVRLVALSHDRRVVPRRLVAARLVPNRVVHGAMRRRASRISVRPRGRAVVHPMTILHLANRCTAVT